MGFLLRKRFLKSAVVDRELGGLSEVVDDISDFNHHVKNNMIRKLMPVKYVGYTIKNDPAVIVFGVEIKTDAVVTDNGSELSVVDAYTYVSAISIDINGKVFVINDIADNSSSIRKAYAKLCDIAIARSKSEDVKDKLLQYSSNPQDLSLLDKLLLRLHTVAVAVGINFGSKLTACKE